MVDIKISADELNDPAIDEIINLEKSLQRNEGQFVDDIPTPLYLNPVFYYAVASFLGAFLVWAISEPFYSDQDDHGIAFISDYLLFGPVAGMIGLAIGLTYGITNRNYRKMYYCSVVGVGVGLGASLLTTFLAEFLFGVTSAMAAYLAHDTVPVPGDDFPFKGVAFFILMCGRGMAWSLVSVGAGLGLGIALKSKKLILNGIAGGMVGGLLGGLLFDPICRFISESSDEAALSRGIGIAAIGILVGFFIGVFENVSKDSWFLMLKGPLTGKQFVLYKSPMDIGSAPKCDIYLFKDPLIDPKHVQVLKSGSKYLIHDQDSEHGTFVNGNKINKYILQEGDVVTIGETVLKYHERERR
ncbi:FHA domain-containing protein [candidate division CSSED10-310 bacterium]|uniref:FHA domain-containing protein n=1 Tax=candidate division CSSED10-310 bacterium TaxID=2855610 RepID=A0ABV6YSV9_UNCC1